MGEGTRFFLIGGVVLLIMGLLSTSVVASILAGTLLALPNSFFASVGSVISPGSLLNSDLLYVTGGYLDFPTLTGIFMAILGTIGLIYDLK